MLKSKVKAAMTIKELEKICSSIEKLQLSLMDNDEEKKIAEILCKLSSDILIDIEYPIIKDYPSLRPVVMLGKAFKDSTYKIIKYNKSNRAFSIVKKGLLPEQTLSVLNEIESNSLSDQYLFWLELEDPDECRCRGTASSN
jgi:hypothetical protein